MTDQMGKVTDTSKYKEFQIGIEGKYYNFSNIKEMVLDPINGIMANAIVVFRVVPGTNSLEVIYDSKDRARPAFKEQPGQIDNESCKTMTPAADYTVVPGEVTKVVVPQECKCTAPAVKEVQFDEAQVALIKAKIAPNCTNTEFELLLYMAKRYNLDPLLRQIWAVKFGDSPAQIYAGRDGFLEIAHRSGHFDGMKSWVDYDDKNKPIKAHCTVWRNDMTHPFESEVLMSEYNTGKSLWTSKPSVMLVKVAESVALRKAFSVSGLYAPEEMGQ